MSRTYKWPIDAAFKSMVAQAVTRKAPIILVKDQGVYLMSTGAKAKDNKVVYAEGFDPSKVAFDDWWEGGDDSIDRLPHDLFRKMVAAKAKTCVIKVTSKQIKIEAKI